jgi:ABC-type taurine transport system substrate-binding protein
VINVTQALHDQGVRAAGDFAKLKGKRFGVTALGSINQYTAAQALLKAGLDPAKDVQWIVNVPQPDLMRMLGQNQVDATDLAYQFGFFAQNNKWGPIVVNDDEVVPGAEIATYAVRKDFLQKNRDAVVRFAMAYLQGIKEFNAAARDPGAHPDIVDILAQNTALNKPELVRAIARTGPTSPTTACRWSIRSWRCRTSGAASISTSWRRRSRANSCSTSTSRRGAGADWRRRSRSGTDASRSCPGRATRDPGPRAARRPNRLDSATRV